MDAETQDLLRQFAREEGAKYQLPPEYVDAVMSVESSGGQDVTSQKGARGPMQLMPDTAKRLGVDINDPIANVRGGIQELGTLWQRFGGDPVKTYAGYNSNPDLVEQRLAKGGFDGLPAETQTALVRLFDKVPHLLEPPAAVAGVAPGAQPPDQSGIPLLTGLTGVHQRPDGRSSTELSIGVQDDRLNGGRETNIPSIVPGQIDLNSLLAGHPPTRAQVDRAIENAVQRQAQGAVYPAFDSAGQASAAAAARSQLKGRLGAGEPPMPFPPMTAATDPVQQPRRADAPFAGPMTDLLGSFFGERSPTGLPQPKFATVAALALPGARSAMGAGLINGLYGGLVAAKSAVAQRLASTPDAGLAALPEAVAAMDPNDLQQIGIATATGTLLGAVGHRIAGALSGPPAEMPNPPSPPKLPTAPTLRALPEPPESLPLPGAPTPQIPPPAPMPRIPTDEEVAVLTAREAQTDAQRAAAARLGGATDAVAARRLVPQPNKPEVDAAYAALRNARGETPINVTGIRARLRGAAINPGELGFGAENFEAPLQDTLDAISRVNAQRFGFAARAEGGGARGGELRVLAGQLYQDVAQQLTPTEQALLAKATDAARTNGQMRRLQALIDTTQDQGVPQGAKGLNRMLNRPQYWRTKLGDDLYDMGVDWFRNVATLQRTPAGERVVGTIARETAAYQEAVATHGARVSEVERRNLAAAQTHADRLTAIEVENTRRLSRYRSSVDAIEARNTERTQTYDEKTAAAREAYARRLMELAPGEPPGAGAFTRTLVQAPFGAALGAAAATGLGFSPGMGALGGAVGFGVPHMIAAPLLDPVFSAGFRFLARHPEGTAQWFETAGRLVLQATYQRDGLTPKMTTPPPPPPYHIPSGGPRPLGRLARP